MWNRSFRWQKQVRLAAGVTTLVAVVASAVFVLGTVQGERARAGAGDLLAEAVATSEQALSVDVPADLNARAGTLVYLERDDGAAQIVGRVAAVNAADPNRVTLEIRLTASLAEARSRGGVLKGASASLDFRDALRLLVTPDTLENEVWLARDAIWPSIQANVLPDLMEGLIRETVNEFAAPNPQEVELLTKSIEGLRETLEPLEEELLDRLTKRAWSVVGFPGLAAGILRSTADGAQNSRVAVTDWWWKMFSSRPNAEAVDRPFFSPETTERLQAALKDETLAFWNEHRSTIVEALTKVALERRPDLEAAFRDRWGALLYERAILPAWQAGQEKVLESVQAYAVDFAARRLLTKEGGPRLLLAYVLRSSLEISDDPLLVLAPNPGVDSRQILYEPMVR